MQFIDNPISNNRGAIEGFLGNLLTPPRDNFMAFRRGRSRSRSRPATARRRLRSATRSRSMTRTRSRGMTRAATTFQHDASFIYGRRRAPRIVRRRARRSQRRYMHNLVNGLGQKSATFSAVSNNQLTPTTLANSQSVFSIGLYGGILNSSTWGDLAEMATNEGLYTAQTGNIFFKSAVMEVQVRNNDTTDPLVIDVYEVIARKEGYNEPDADWVDGIFNQASTTGMGSATTGQLGITPFDAPGFCSSWLIKNKTRYRVSPGISIYLQLRDAKDYMFNTDRFEYDAGTTSVRTRMFRGLSKGYLIVARSSAVDTATPKLFPIDYDIIATKTYHFAVQKDAEDMVGVQ